MLPINHLGRRPVVDTNNRPVAVAPGFRFDQLTLSALEPGSPLYWVHFVFVYCVTFWVMWLLVKYYQARAQTSTSASLTPPYPFLPLTSVSSDIVYRHW